jgi:SAM-dependent methyltransferase
MSGEHVASAVNVDAWEQRTRVHFDAPMYGVDAFRDGATTLKAPELELVGDVRGRRLLHLQCHFGLDTLSWARRGAIATGVDFSPAAIAAARRHAREQGMEATFICEDVQRLGALPDRFDVAVATYGVMCWIGSLSAWAGAIAANLAPGGRFVLVEFHPLLELLAVGKVSGADSYFGWHNPVHSISTGTYAAPGASIAYEEYRWQHTVGDVATALLDAGLALEGVHELPFCAYPLLEGLQLGPDGLWWPADESRVPYMYALVARAPR